MGIRNRSRLNSGSTAQVSTWQTNDAWVNRLYPDFDKILDFTSAGSESSTSVNVNGDTDLEYKVIIRNLGSQNIYTRLNNDSGAAAYGYQRIYNDVGSISTARATLDYLYAGPVLTEVLLTILTPSGFIKTCFMEAGRYSSGTTVAVYYLAGSSYNSTSNITTVNFVNASGNFTSGTRIIVYRRRVNI